MVNTRLKLGDYEAWVIVGNEEVEHYDIEVNEETKVVTCWIASTAGKHFGVWVGKRHDNFDCVVNMLLDGSWMRGVFLLKPNMKPSLMEHAWVGDNSARPFLFGVLHLTDDESALGTQSYEELGNIKLTINRALNHETVSRPAFLAIPENDKIHERAKKAVTHRISFGEPKATASPGYASCTYADKVATFVFRYRSLDLLRANAIAPCDPPPVDTATASEAPSASVSTATSDSVSKKRKASVKEEEEEAVENDSEDEADKRREAELEAQLESVRRARRDRKHASKKVKREPKSVFLPGEVIDLTI